MKNGLSLGEVWSNACLSADDARLFSDDAGKIGFFTRVGVKGLRLDGVWRLFDMRARSFKSNARFLPDDWPCQFGNGVCSLFSFDFKGRAKLTDAKLELKDKFSFIVANNYENKHTQIMRRSTRKRSTRKLAGEDIFVKDKIRFHAK